MTFEQAKEAYESADDTWAALKPSKRTPTALTQHHAAMAPLAAACRDAATSEYDRCYWDTRWYGHWVAGRTVGAEAAVKVRPVKVGPAQMSLF